MENQPAPPVSAVSIAFQPAPPASISQISTTKVTAVVRNDPTNAGVDWVLLCQDTGNCGTLSSLHTTSGTPTTYTPPAAPSGNVQPITIEAFATADHTKNVVAVISVTGFAGNLKGTYVFETKGVDANGAYQLAGVIVLDGNGNITSGEQTHNDPLLSVSDAIVTGSSYTIGPDGRGTLTLITNDANIGQQGIENLSLVFLSNAKAFISTLDNDSNQSLPPSHETSSGTLELQTSKTAPSGGYAFTVSGVDRSNASLALGGILNITSPNTISGVGSVVDQDDAGAVSLNAAISGTLTPPDSLGSLKLSLTTGFPSSLQFTGYIVNAMHIKLIESDNTGPGTGATTAGVAIGQGPATGTFQSSSFAGSYVFDILGLDPQSGGVPNTMASLGQFTATASGLTTGALNGESDNEVVIASNVIIADSFAGTYTLDSRGRIDSTITFTTSGAGPELIFYLTGNGNPPLVLDADDNPSSSAVGAIGVGVARPQAAPPFSFNGRYGLTFTETSSAPIHSNNATGQITANGAAHTLTGMLDADANFLPQTPTSLSGTFASIPSSAPFSGTLTDTLFNPFSPSTSTIPVAFYPVDPDHIFFIETDSATSFELTFGSLAVRTPVCPTCP